ncbi:MAG: S-adenosylmethionine:tRNA ribosyltransferase-isomerase [Bacteroidetes bacterium]|nr:S-adenosylmethionine:tRNA ribosyltransferase-isomerase [Bacteroidota bacterium]
MTTDPRHLRISDYDYPLPDDRIAQEPCDPRDAAKLLVWKRGTIRDLGVRDAPEVVASWGPFRLVVNEARVVPARIFLPRPSGAGHIELFYLDAEGLSVEQAMAKASVLQAWCKVRPSKKWKDGVVLQHPCGLTASRLAQRDGESLVEFRWSSGQTWAQILNEVGRIPLPPYMHRADTEADRDRYQSVFARHEGSVAAPTASLHWTPELMRRWREVCADTQSVTLHVGAGTFQPVSAEAVGDHHMHAEEVVVRRDVLEALADGLPVLAMGTTAARTLESLYWWALEWQRSGTMPSYVDQWAPYEGLLASGFSAQGGELLDPEVCALFTWAAKELTKLGHGVVSFRTALIVAPGYSFRVVKALITNFHQPQSTLLLLVSAGLGTAWRGVYEHALANNYRFLSYGDANLYRF